MNLGGHRAYLTAILGMKYGRNGRKPRSARISRDRAYSPPDLVEAEPSSVAVRDATFDIAVPNENNVLEDSLDLSALNVFDADSWSDPSMSHSLFLQDHWMRAEDWELYHAK